MNRVRPLLICLLAAILVISLPKQKWELARAECCAGVALPSLPAAPVPQQWTRRKTAVGQAAGETAVGVRGSARAPFAETGSGRAVQVVTAPGLARGWENSNGGVTSLAPAETHAPLVGLLNPSMKDDGVVCGAATLSNCGYVSKKGPFPLNLRRSGAGIALTISNTDIWIEPGGVKFSTSVKF